MKEEAQVLLPPSAIELLHQRPCGYYDDPQRRAMPLAEREVIVKWFAAGSHWTWWVFEGDPVDINQHESPSDWYLYCLVSGHEVEFGYTLYSEIERTRQQLLRTPTGVFIERDLHHTPAQWQREVHEMRKGGALSAIP